MSPAATIAVTTAVLAATLTLGLLLAVWAPMWAAATCAAGLLAEESRRGLRRWRAAKTWARRLSR